MNASTKLTLGIDFGTSNTAAALMAADGQMHTMLLDESRAEMPTALFFCSETQSVFYGVQAMQAYLLGTEGRLLRSLKSLLGSALMDEYTAVGERSVRYFDIVVLFFKELKRRCEAQVGQVLTRAMLGRPVHFVDDDLVRDAHAQDTLGRAAQAAGFSDIAFQLEPIAAALDFEQRVRGETTALVVDIGGGTSDFTVIRLNPTRSHLPERSQDILATTGIHIGGTDFDRLLDLAAVMPLLGYKHIGSSGRLVPSSVFFDLSTWHLIHQAYSRKALHFAQALNTDYTNPQLHARLMHALHGQYGHRILAQVEAAKIACSNSGQDVVIPLEFLLADPASCEPLSSNLSSPVMQTSLHAALKQVVQCALDCVNESGLRGVDVLYLTGGSSALRPLVEALRTAMPAAKMVEGNRFGGVAAGLAVAGARWPRQLE